MSKVHGASKVSPVKSKLATFVAIVIGFVSLGLAPAYALDERVIDVVEVTWNGAATPIGGVNVLAEVIDKEVNADWVKFTTMFGDTEDRTISFKTGKVLQAPITLTTKMPCYGQASNSFMNSIIPEAYKRLGITDYKERYLLVVSPKAGCVWSGRAQMGDPDSKNGILVLHDSTSSFVISHELGHTFGLGHSNFLRCDNGANDGPWGSNCKGVEYGGTIDVMGNVDTTSPLSTYHQWRMGLMKDSQVKQVWQTETINLAPSNFANGTKAIFVRDGKSAYWIEYRLKLEGVVYKPGLAIYRLDPPPISSVVSPNPEDAGAPEYSEYLSSDFWMLNLDTYKYTTSSNMGGSMTGLSATTYSGDVSISAVPSETGAVVTIKKKADVTPPPVPSVLPVEQWISPNMVIIKSGQEDADTAIAGYESKINDVVAPMKAVDVDGWIPTFLSPFVAPKTVYLRDLPEGSFTFAMRSIDMVGNKSDWSTTQKVMIDRGHPVVTNDFALTGVNSKEVLVAWKGAIDPGSGICQANIVVEDGLIIQSSNAKNAPAFKVPSGTTITGIAQVFDCLGNGQLADLTIATTYIPADKSSRTGKWSSAANAGAGALKCVGKCTASISTRGKVDLVLAGGAASVSIGNKVIATIADNKNKSLTSSTTIDVGATKKVIRITGSNFTLVGLAAVSTTLGPQEEIDRRPVITDPSLTDSKQAVLGKQGFRGEDFSQEWSVLPMVNGTTLLDPSLDLCNGKFESEKDRAERRQVLANKVGSTFTFLSTEVVRYTSAAAASAAQKELVKVLTQCQADKGYKDQTGTLVPYDFKKLPTIPAGVVSEGNRVFVHAVIGLGENARSLLGFYQFNGDIFSGLYVLNEDGFSEAQVAKWLKVAATMGQRLQGKAA
jgi:hypothetical protein